MIDAAEVIRKMIEIRQGFESQDQRAADLGLEEDELAFYDAVAKNVEGIYDHAFLAPLIHEVVQTIKSRLKVEWTEGHREDVKAAVRLAVKQVLIRNGVQREDFERIVPFVMEQAEAAYRDWPLVA